MSPPSAQKIMLEITVQVHQEAWNNEVGDPAAVLAKVLAVVHQECPQARAESGEVCFVLSDDSHVEALNEQFRGLDKATNVLSFPAHPGPLAQAAPVSGDTPPLGDVVFGLETMQRESVEQSKTLPDHFVHLAVHGLLHLLGYDHIDQDQAATMETLETSILAKLGISDPYVERTSHVDDLHQ